MGYPAVTLTSANSIFAGINVQIVKHSLGYYCATVGGEELKEARLIDLAHAILRRLNCND